MKNLIAASLLFTVSVPVMAQDSDDLKRDMKALELYLQDQSDHKEFCPSLNWDQPDISVYKKQLKSQLPENCKK